jgi:hypothetical protein
VEWSLLFFTIELTLNRKTKFLAALTDRWKGLINKNPKQGSAFLNNLAQKFKTIL